MNNFKQIRSLLSFENSGDFYFIQIFKRRKDNPSLPKSEKLIDSFSIYSLEEYDNLEEKIIAKCKEHNARAYIRLNKRNSRNVALHMINALSDYILSGNHNHIHKIYNSVVGKYHSDKHKSWLVDIDGDRKLASEIMGFILEICDNPISQCNNTLIPTLNGYHYICRPFNRKLFSEKYPDIDIHLDNPTLLFYESTIIKEGREKII